MITGQKHQVKKDRNTEEIRQKPQGNKKGTPRKQDRNSKEAG